MNRHCIPEPTAFTASLTHELLCECPGIIKTIHQGLARTRIALCQRPSAGLKKPDVMIWRGKICVVF